MKLKIKFLLISALGAATQTFPMQEAMSLPALARGASAQMSVLVQRGKDALLNSSPRARIVAGCVAVGGAAAVYALVQSRKKEKFEAAFHEAASRDEALFNILETEFQQKLENHQRVNEAYLNSEIQEEADQVVDQDFINGQVRAYARKIYNKENYEDYQNSILSRFFFKKCSNVVLVDEVDREQNYSKANYVFMMALNEQFNKYWTKR